ncbi:MAG: class I SAM-dependent methyltransferase [Thermodesulfovibrionales bacterium]|jgi:SAM-dependent methyltransferase
MNNVCVLCNRELHIVSIRNIAKGGEIYDVFFCEACNVGSTVPKPSREVLAELYASTRYRSQTGKRFNFLIEAVIYLFRLHRKRRIVHYIPGGRILDIGCGRGLFLDIMRKAGWSVTGIEFNEETASYASAGYGLDVLSGDLTEHEFPDGFFDVISMNHVLEHVVNPRAMVEECTRILRKGGLLVIAVPNLSSLQASAGKRAWFHLDVPFHLCHFSEEGLVALLRKDSFLIKKVRRFDLEYNPFGWLQTLLNVSGIRENVLYNLLKTVSLRKSEMKPLSIRDALLTFMLLPIFLPLSLALSLYESLVKKGGTIEVFAIRE